MLVSLRMGGGDWMRRNEELVDKIIVIMHSVRGQYFLLMLVHLDQNRH